MPASVAKKQPGPKRKLSAKERASRQRSLVAKRAGEASVAYRDIGRPPRIKNARQRNRCRKSLRLFCETYGGEACCWPWSDDHLLVIRAIEQSVFRGALLAVAMPRGSGKTTLCRLAVLWAISYAHVSYAFLVGANEEKAVANLDAIKLWMRELEPFTADFPEISHAVRSLGGIANRASGQLCDGEPTLIRWEKNRVVLPRVRKPENMRSKGRHAPTSGSVIGVSGLTGEGIRGSLFAHPDGSQLRPDFVLLDDPQTDESARSRQQNIDRLALIRGAVLGMAGPGKRISAVMPCTVIRPGDMVDQVLDRKKFPLWRGVRTRLMRSMPTNMPAWEKYWEVYGECMGREVPDVTPANEYYLAHREQLDAGADAAWDARKDTNEVSAVQHAMNLYCERGPEAFWAEFQNEPLPDADESSPLRLTAEQITSKLSQLARGVVPKQAQWIAAYIDVHDRLLYYVVSAWSQDFAGGPIDYGTFPKQPLGYFQQQSAPVGMADAFPGRVEDAWITAGLESLAERLLATSYTREDGATLKIGRLLIDAKWGQKTELVKQFCRRHPDAGRIVLPAMGIGFTATRKSFSEYRPEPGAQIGLNWRLALQPGGDRVLSIDTNWWKTFAATRLGMPPGTPGGWELFGRDARVHGLFAAHCIAEEPKTVLHKESGRERIIWEWKPGRPDNHYWDCLCGSAVAGSMLGASIPGIETRKRARPDERQTLAELAGRVG